MSKASTHLENGILNYFFRKQSVAQPTEVYLALYTTNPGDTDGGSEVNGGSYARQRITFGAPEKSGASSVLKNSTKVEFPKATGEWGRVLYFGIRDAVSGGNLLVYGVIASGVTISSGDQLFFDVGTIQVTVA